MLHDADSFYWQLDGPWKLDMWLAFSVFYFKTNNIKKKKTNNIK